MHQKQIARTLAAAALTGMLVGSAGYISGCSQDRGTKDCSSMGAHHECKGKNACKGQGGCKTSDQGCKGKNSCKGNGGCKA